MSGYFRVKRKKSFWVSNNAPSLQFASTKKNVQMTSMITAVCRSSYTNVVLTRKRREIQQRLVFAIPYRSRLINDKKKFAETRKIVERKACWHCVYNRSVVCRRTSANGVVNNSFGRLFCTRQRENASGKTKQ